MDKLSRLSGRASAWHAPMAFRALGDHIFVSPELRKVETVRTGSTVVLKTLHELSFSCFRIALSMMPICNSMARNSRLHRVFQVCNLSDAGLDLAGTVRSYCSNDHKLLYLWLRKHAKKPIQDLGSETSYLTTLDILEIFQSLCVFHAHVSNSVFQALRGSNIHNSFVLCEGLPLSLWSVFRNHIDTTKSRLFLYFRIAPELVISQIVSGLNLLIAYLIVPPLWRMEPSL